MLSNSYFSSDIKTLIELGESSILGKLNQNHLLVLMYSKSLLGSMK